MLAKVGQADTVLAPRAVCLPLPAVRGSEPGQRTGRYNTKLGADEKKQCTFHGANGFHGRFAARCAPASCPITARESLRTVRMEYSSWIRGTSMSLARS